MFRFSFSLPLRKICLISLVFIISCAGNPQLGEKITRTKLDDGITLTETESRSLLPGGKIAGQDSALASIESTVYKIDYRNRTIGLKTEQGEAIDLVAGQDVRNFDQIQAGDKVKVEYLVSVAFEVRAPTKEELAVASEGALEISSRARLGSMPSGGTARAGISICKVNEVDLKTSKITLENINTGKKAEVQARYPENLSYVKSGDSVVITAVEAVAASVSRIP